MLHDKACGLKPANSAWAAGDRLPARMEAHVGGTQASAARRCQLMPTGAPRLYVLAIDCTLTCVRPTMGSLVHESKSDAEGVTVVLCMYSNHTYRLWKDDGGIGLM